MSAVPGWHASLVPALLQEILVKSAMNRWDQRQDRNARMEQCVMGEYVGMLVILYMERTILTGHAMKADTSALQQDEECRECAWIQRQPPLLQLPSPFPI